MNADDMQIKRAAATWILKTLESCRIPISVMDSMIQNVQSLFDSNLSMHIQASAELRSVTSDCSKCRVNIW